jgi:hypothetical protein
MKKSAPIALTLTLVTGGLIYGCTRLPSVDYNQFYSGRNHSRQDFFTAIPGPAKDSTYPRSLSETLPAGPENKWTGIDTKMDRMSR